MLAAAVVVGLLLGCPMASAAVSLSVSRDDGSVVLTNDAAAPQSVSVYSIETLEGGFDRDNWQSIAAQGLDTDDIWVEFGTETGIVGDLSEGALSGSYSLGASGTAADSVNLGLIWIPSPYEDLSIEFRDVDGNLVATEIMYAGNSGLPIGAADYDFDGAVDADDFGVMQLNLISDVSELPSFERYLHGDLNDDGLVNQLDFRQFKQLYEADQGVGSFAALLSSRSVPEPCSLTLAALCVVGLVAFRIRPSRAICVGLALSCSAWTADAATAQTVDSLRLLVNTDSGAVHLRGGASDAELDFYEIRSGGGGLIAAEFTGLEAASGFDGWVRNAVVGPMSLSESMLGATGSEFTTISAGAPPIALGDIYETSAGGTRDLQLLYYDIQGVEQPGLVEYFAGSLPDFNSDGLVDLADYTIWRDHLGFTGATLQQGDADGDGAVTPADYQAWKAYFGAVANTAPPALVTTHVPEPTASQLAVLSIGCGWALRRRKSTR